VVGAYGYRNVGDEAILAGLLERLGRTGVTVVSRDPAETTRLHGVAAVGIAGVLPALVRHRSLIIGGGGVFGRDMGFIGRLLPGLGLIASAGGRPVAVVGVDLDSSLAPSVLVLVPRLLRGAGIVAVRDRTSAEIARGWGVEAAVEPDLSAWMRRANGGTGRRLLRDAGITGDRPIVGLALAGVRPILADLVLDAVSGAMGALDDVDFCFFPMSRNPRVPDNDDLRLGLRLRERHPRLAIVEAGAQDPARVLDAFGGLSAVVAMRYHAMLFAERAGVPLVGLTYAEKTTRWLTSRGMVPITPEAGAVTAALRVALASWDEHGTGLDRVAS
jgi:polysaccharide pyruvyl transferase WcaK-like protein